MTSGTAGWKNKPSTMPIASAAMPIMRGFPSAFPSPESAFFLGSSASPKLFSLGPNLFGEFDIPDCPGRQRQTVGDVHGDTDTVGELQQPEPLQSGAVVEDVSHCVWRSDREDLVGAAGGVVVDQDRSPGLADGHIRSDARTVDRNGLGTAGPQRVDHELQVAIQDDLPAAVDSLLGHVGKVR